MHVPDGFLSTPVLVGGLATTAIGTGVALYRLEDRDIPKVAILSSAFFAVSLLHIPTPMGVPIHLVLSGLVGVLLGWAAFPAVLVALILQKVLFQHGGLVSVGVNTTIMAAPGILFASLLRRFLDPKRPVLLAVSGGLMGFGSVALGLLLLGTAFLASGKELEKVARMIALAGLPLGLLEGLVTASVVSYLARVRPSLLASPATTLVRWRTAHET